MMQLVTRPQWMQQAMRKPYVNWIFRHLRRFHIGIVLFWDDMVHHFTSNWALHVSYQTSPEFITSIIAIMFMYRVCIWSSYLFVVASELRCIFHIIKWTLIARVCIIRNTRFEHFISHLFVAYTVFHCKIHECGDQCKSKSSSNIFNAFHWSVTLSMGIYNYPWNCRCDRWIGCWTCRWKKNIN